MAFSLDNYRAKTPEDFDQAAALCVHLIQAQLALLDGQHGKHMHGNVVNVNIPFCGGSAQPQGFYLAHMSSACAMFAYDEADADQRQQALAAQGLTDSDKLHVLTTGAKQFQKCVIHSTPTAMSLSPETTTCFYKACGLACAR